MPLLGWSLKKALGVGPYRKVRPDELAVGIPKPSWVSAGIIMARLIQNYQDVSLRTTTEVEAYNTKTGDRLNLDFEGYHSYRESKDCLPLRKKDGVKYFFSGIREIVLTVGKGKEKKTLVIKKDWHLANKLMKDIQKLLNLKEEQRLFEIKQRENQESLDFLETVSPKALPAPEPSVSKTACKDANLSQGKFLD